MMLFELFGFGPKGWGGLMLLAAVMTIAVTLTAMAIGAVFGGLVAWAKLSKNVVARYLGSAYSTIFRGVPELLVIYLFYFGGSSAVTAIGALLKIDGFLGIPSFLAGALAVGIISGAYQAEVYRGAFLAVSKHEIEAAAAIGMSRALRMRRIIVPQVMRFALPGLGNVWQLSIKDSALISVTGLAELMRQSQVGAGSTHRYFEFYIAGGLLYLLVTQMSNHVFNKAEARINRSFRGGIGRA
jgi:octopine/nopaline transport system permease protein